MKFVRARGVQDESVVPHIGADPYCMTNTAKAPKTGGRAPARASDFHHVTIRMTDEEHKLFRVASAHAGVSGGDLVARWTKRYLARVGVRVGTATEAKEEA